MTSDKAIKIVLVTGDRFWQDYEPIFNRLKHEMADVVIQGAAKGADLLAQDACLHLGYSLEVISPSATYEDVWPMIQEYSIKGRRLCIADPANWNFPQYKSGGPIRNSHMLTVLGNRVDYAFAFHNNIEKSKGTKDMLRKTLSKNIWSEIYSAGTWRPIYKGDPRLKR